MATKTKKLKDPNTFPIEPDLDRLTSRLFKYLYYRTKSASKSYLNGGRGCEDVMTFELLLALNYLPRSTFLAPIIRNAFRGADETRNLLANEAEVADFVFVPNSCYLVPEKRRQSDSVVPDAIASSNSTYCFLECKGPSKNAQFQAEQLAREFVLVCREAVERQPLLLVVTANPGLQRVEKSKSRVTIEDAIRKAYPTVVKKTVGINPAAMDLKTQIPRIVAHATWDDIWDALDECLATYQVASKNQTDVVNRLATDVLLGIRWHLSN